MTDTPSSTSVPPTPPPPPTAPPPPPPGYGSSSSGPPPSGPPPRGPGRLVRDPDDAVVAGVCAAVGRHTGTDPVLWRVTIAVLALFGGAGVVLYALGWLLVPRRDEAQSVLERLVRRPDGGVGPGGVVLAVVAGVVLLAVLEDGPGFGVLLVLGALAYLVLRERREPGVRPFLAGPAPAGGPWPGTTAMTGAATTSDVGSAPASEPFSAPSSGPSYGPPGAPPPYGDPVGWPVPPPAPRRRRSRLGPLTLSAAALVTGVLLALRLSGLDGVTAPRVVAVALLVVGAGLVVGTWVGRARWLIAVGAVLALLLAGTAAAERAELDDGLGQRSWTPTGNASYRLGVGEGVLDLRALPAGRTVAVDARIGLGELTVLVPDDRTVRVDAEVGVGEISETGPDGIRLSHGDDDSELHEVFVVGDPADRVGARLDLEVGMGHVEVRRVAA